MSGMTREEAIKNVTTYVLMECENMPNQVIKALDIMRECTKKQIPKKVTAMNEKEDGSFYRLDFVCPTCDEPVICQPYRPKHCKHCGQALDWSEEND